MRALNSVEMTKVSGNGGKGGYDGGKGGHGGGHGGGKS